MKKNFYENPFPKEWVEAMDAMDRDPVHQREQQQRCSSLDYVRFHFGDLRREYLDQWVAVWVDRVVAQGDTIEAVADAVKGAGIPIRAVALEYVSPEGTEFIL